jgi:putative transposase
MCSRDVVLAGVRDNMESALVEEAARMALTSALSPERAHHADQGSQYTSESFGLLLEKAGVAQSLSRVGNCYDNAQEESFWATVKTECFDNFRSGLPVTKAQALSALFRYIELFYNQERLHSALGYRSPVQFEQDWANQNFTDVVST